jgi:DNA methylase
MPRNAPAPLPDNDLTETLERLDLATLRPHPRNDGTHPPDELAHLKASITQHGIYRNVVVANDGTILAGHGVVQAARELGQTHIPGQRMPYGPDDPQALQLLVGDNHIARLRMQDDALLAAVLQDVARDDVAALLGTGFDEAALEVLAQAQGLAGGGTEAAVAEPEEPWDRLAEVLERWQVQEGDLWALGRHRILHGSCLDAPVLARLLGDVVPTMVFADPPYGVSIVATNVAVGNGEAYDIPFGGVKQPRRRSPVGGGQRTKDLTGHYPIDSWSKGSIGGANPRGSKHNLRIAPDLIPGKYAPVIGDDSTATAIKATQFFLTTYPDAVQVWWGGNYYADHLPASSCWLVWDKETTGNFADCELAWTNQPTAAKLFHHRWNGMLRASEHERRWHPTQKPAALAAWVYEELGAGDDVIFDPFLGSAPSLLAAEQRGRTVYGCELSLEYIAIALERWHALTGAMPERLA